MQKFINEWVIPAFITFVIVTFINKLIFILVTVPTGSMETTIMPGDRLYINRLFDMKRGDIIVFRSDELNVRLVKRLIGLPGETVNISEKGDVFINGEKLEEPYVNQVRGEPQIFEIPEGNYFFLGDNRPISVDARYWESPYIPENKIIGKAEFRFFPFNRMGKLE